jgi:RimJ/RimL family protein N-acetyltransferase
LPAGGGIARLNTMLALLRQSEHDPDVFCAAGDTLLDALHATPDCNREAWSEALEQVWLNHLAAPEAAALHRQLAPAAMQVGDWALARRTLRRGMAIHGENANDLAHLAWVEARTGGIVDAERIARRALALEPESRMAREVVTRIGARLAARNGQWDVAIRHRSLPLVLEPLDVSHAEALLHQYRDPQIAVMTGLQPLATLEDARKWIGEHVDEPGRRAYAVMHADHGFVGYVCLSVSARESYFCFWVGVDFQGRRFAGEAARMACGFARERGINTIFTSAYDDNARSIRALERIGFIPLAVRALPPENDRLFLFMRTGCDTGGDPVAELIDYYEREKLPISFVPREQWVTD